MSPDDSRVDDQLEIRTLMAADLAAAQRWVQSAGWNQLPPDWLRLLSYAPQGCFVAVWDGLPVGSVTTLCYGSELAWIGMMLVDPDYRRRGIAAALMRRSIAYARETGIGWIQLDATDQGRPVYERLGFRPQWNFHRWLRASDAPPVELRAAPQPLLHTALDRMAFGADRTRWLQRLAKDSVMRSTADGFGMMRPGRLATYLGPVTARHPMAAETLIGDLLHSVAGPVFWDIPGPNQAAQQLAQSLGFQPARSLLRMAIGQPTIPPQLGLQFALADPATG